MKRCRFHIMIHKRDESWVSVMLFTLRIPYVSFIRYRLSFYLSRPLPLPHTHTHTQPSQNGYGLGANEDERKQTNDDIYSHIIQTELFFRRAHLFRFVFSAGQNQSIWCTNCISASKKLSAPSWTMTIGKINIFIWRMPTKRWYGEDINTDWLRATVVSIRRIHICSSLLNGSVLCTPMLSIHCRAFDLPLSFPVSMSSRISNLSFNLIYIIGHCERVAL